ELLLPYAPELKCCLFLIDPAFAARAHAAGVGADIDGQLGAVVDSRYSRPLAISGRIQHLSDGIFIARGPAFNGRRFSVGATAVLATDNLRIVIASNPVMMIDPELYRSQGVEPGLQDV